MYLNSIHLNEYYTDIKIQYNVIYILIYPYMSLCIPIYPYISLYVPIYPYISLTLISICWDICIYMA